MASLSAEKDQGTTSRLTLRDKTGLVRSFEYTEMCFTTRPDRPAVSTVALICPVAPGSRWSELTTAAAHPQEGWIFSMIRVSLPTLRTVNTWTTCVPCEIFPKS